MTVMDEGGREGSAEEPIGSGCARRRRIGAREWLCTEEANWSAEGEEEEEEM